MSDSKVKLGNGIADGLKSETNQELLSIHHLPALSQEMDVNAFAGGIYSPLLLSV